MDTIFNRCEVVNMLTRAALESYKEAERPTPEEIVVIEKEYREYYEDKKDLELQNIFLINF